MGIYCFIHVCNKTIGLLVFKQQLLKIINSGLYKKLRKIYIGYLGEYCLEFKELLFKYDKLHLIFYSKDLSLMEFPTLTELHRFCCESYENHKILYIHTKGVRFPKSIYLSDWRNYMEYFLIEKHTICLNDLDTYDALGVNFKSNPWCHFSGNFWWTKSDYVKKLKYIKDIDNGFRRSAELWLLSCLSVEYRSKLKIIEAKYGNKEKKIDITSELNNMILFDKIYINSKSNLLSLIGCDPSRGKEKKIEITYSKDSNTREYIEINESGNQLKKSLLICGNGYKIQMKCYHKSNISHYTQRYLKGNYI